MSEERVQTEPQTVKLRESEQQKMVEEIEDIVITFQPVVAAEVSIFFSFHFVAFRI